MHSEWTELGAEVRWRWLETGRDERRQHTRRVADLTVVMSKMGSEGGGRVEVAYMLVRYVCR
jgi:hypothetical protein